MGVERHVVGGQGEVRVEEGSQALLHRGADRARVKIPEQTVVAEHELGVAGGGLGEELELCAHPCDLARDLLRPRHLQAIGAVVREVADLQQLVQERDDLVARRHKNF